MKTISTTIFSVLASLVILLASCTLTTSKPKDPEFVDMQELQGELNSVVQFQNINISGKEITKNKKTTSEVEVAVINGVNIPTDDDQRNELAKSLAQSVKRNLKDANAFDTYQIIFVAEEKNGAVTNRKWTKMGFKSADL